MKTILRIGIPIMIFLVASCNFDDNPIGLVTKDQIDTEPDSSSIVSNVNSTYHMLSSTLNILTNGEFDWDNGTVTRNDFVLQDIASGDMTKKWVSDGDQAWMDEFENFSFTSINQAFNGIWSYDYEGISRANESIETLEDDEIMSEVNLKPELQDRLLGEVYFLRAFYYFDLVNNFGDVPLLKEPLEDFDDAYSVSNRADKNEVYGLIIDDFQKSVKLLPERKYSNTEEPWRVSKGAAKAMQAKVALFQRDWNEVLTAIDELESWGYFSLNANYFDSFDVNKEFSEDEVIFAYDHCSENNPDRSNGLTTLMGWGFIAPSDEFISSFEEGDPRLSYTVNPEEELIYKLLGSPDDEFFGDEDSPGNRIYIRYADVLLWKAEALIENGDTENGLQIIDQIRKRAEETPSLNGDGKKLPKFSNKGLDQKEALQVLREERRHELGLESHRFNDLKRWGIAKTYLEKRNISFSEDNYLYPIPQDEIDKSGGEMSQNNGY